jgi:DNA topoisomerase VI subunit A
MLQIPRGQLRILATSKGLIAGNLTYTNTNGIEIDCSASTHGKSSYILRRQQNFAKSSPYFCPM